MGIIISRAVITTPVTIVDKEGVLNDATKENSVF
jgi:hypothetical protein